MSKYKVKEAFLYPHGLFVVVVVDISFCWFFWGCILFRTFDQSWICFSSERCVNEYKTKIMSFVRRSRMINHPHRRLPFYFPSALRDTCWRNLNKWAWNMGLSCPCVVGSKWQTAWLTAAAKMRPTKHGSSTEVVGIQKCRQMPSMQPTIKLAAQYCCQKVMIGNECVSMFPNQISRLFWIAAMRRKKKKRWHFNVAPLCTLESAVPVDIDWHLHFLRNCADEETMIVVELTIHR